MEETTNFVSTWDHVNLNDVDPSFASIDEGYYNLRLTTAELRPFTYGPQHETRAGEKDELVSLSFTITGDQKFSGRRVFPSALFPNGFGKTILRRLQDAAGISQDGDFKSWLKEMTTTGPVFKLYVYNKPDEIKGVPNPKNVKADGSAGDKPDIDWKKGIQPASE